MKHIVGVADMKISGCAEDEIVTHALGSCLGITLYDPVAQVGGLLHVMLPDSTIDSKKAVDNPFMFVDSGLPRLFHSCYKLGAEKGRVVIKVAGGACVIGKEENDLFSIGKRNFVTLRKILWKNGVLLKSHDVGGNSARTMCMSMDTGDVTVKINKQSILL